MNRDGWKRRALGRSKRHGTIHPDQPQPPPPPPQKKNAEIRRRKKAEREIEGVTWRTQVGGK